MAQGVSRDADRDSVEKFHRYYLEDLRAAFQAIEGFDKLLDESLPLSPSRAVRRTLRRISERLLVDNYQFFHSLELGEIDWPSVEVEELRELAAEVRDAVYAGSAPTPEGQQSLDRIATAIASTAFIASELIAKAKRLSGFPVPQVSPDCAGAVLLSEAELQSAEQGGPSKANPASTQVSDDSLPAARRRVAPSRIKAKALYDWAMSAIADAEKMTIYELFDAIDSHPSDGNMALPPNAATFAKYLRDAGVKRYSTRKDRTKGKSIQDADDL